LLSNSISGTASYTQAGRVVRLVRLVRLVRVYRIAAEKRARKEHEETLDELARIGAITWDEVEAQKLLFNSKQSRLGKQLSDSITRRVIIMILILLIIIPVIMYQTPNAGPEFTAQVLNIFNTDTGVSIASKTAAIEAFRTNMIDSVDDNRYIERLIMSPSLGSDPYIYFPGNLDEIREVAKIEYDYHTVATDGSGNPVTYYTDVLYSFNYYLRQVALYDILITIFVAIMMIGGAIIFSNDAEQLVIKPIERMVTLVEAVAQNPLGNFSFEFTEGENTTGQYETKLLEATVEKITGLLRVGFGEAGAGIISANLSASSGSAGINPLLPGIRIYAIFGFCDIHHFEEINLKLSNDVLIFINTLADVVHGNIHKWDGQVNKNLGNAFVVVWRIGDELTIKSQQSGYNLRGGGGGGKGKGTRGSFTSEKPGGMSQRSNGNVSDSLLSGGSDSEKESSNHSDDGSNTATKRKIHIDLRRVPGVDILADHALVGYLKIIAEINRNKAILKYRSESRLTDNGKHEFKVRMGFGLHAGWAIEGAVGSIQKVDATYLSPHVNMAARLETSSRQYGVPLLASQDFYDLLGPEAQMYCRKLDVVTVKGSEVPIGIYTYDALQEQDFKNESKNRPSWGERGGVSSVQSSPQVQSRKSFEKSSKAKAAAIASAVSNNDPNVSPSGTFIGSLSFGVKGGEGKEGEKGGSGNGSKEPTPPGSGNSSPIRRPSMNTFNASPTSQKALMFLTSQDQSADILENDYDLLTLRQHVTLDFTETHKAGVTAYLNGEWIAAKELLERADSMMLELAPVLGGDGPSRTLLNYMKNRDFTAPSDWNGYRPLTSK
jgi:class 3 adenylate cyclase